ncbi:MAG: nitroreductase family protein [Chlorobiaceae bacterium]
MPFRDLVTKCRSYRRFDQSHQVEGGLLRDLVELASMVPSAKNLQPLKYIAISDHARASALFPLLSWAGYLAEWPGPSEEERPTAYIIMLGDSRICRDFACDSGIAAQTILLGATFAGLGGCIVASIDREKARTQLKIPDHFEILMVIAIGLPRESVVIDRMAREDDVRYYRDAHAIHHVPKRPVDEILLDFN